MEEVLALLARNGIAVEARPGLTALRPGCVHQRREAGGRLVVNSQEAGELVAGIAAGQLDETVIAAELGGIRLGRAPGREREDEICIFKSTGLAVEDPVTARAILGTALAAGCGDARGDPGGSGVTGAAGALAKQHGRWRCSGCVVLAATLE